MSSEELPSRLISLANATRVASVVSAYFESSALATSVAAPSARRIVRWP